MCKLAWFPSIDRLKVCQCLPAIQEASGRMCSCCDTMSHSFQITSALERPTQEEIPDVERYGHCFSDGVGEISQEMLHACLARVPFGYQSVEDGSAVQVRWFIV